VNLHQNAGSEEERPVGAVRWLAVLPFLALCVGMFFANRTTPFVLGMPFILFWTVLWVVLTSVIMAVIYKFDPANRGGGS
jgi:hypothetical protein